MKKILLALALLLAIPAICLAQTAAKPSSPKKAITIAGQISNDGKTLVSNSDDIWTIANPAVAAGHEASKLP